MTTIDQLTTRDTHKDTDGGGQRMLRTAERITLECELTVIPISDYEWRISDPARRADDALCLIGFVQEMAGTFEVTRIGAPLERHYFRTLSSAIDFLSEIQRSDDLNRSHP